MKSSLNLLLAVFHIVLIFAPPSFAGVKYRYYRMVVQDNSNKPKANFKLVKMVSKDLSFLDCPLEMIDRQWGGIKSVIDGYKYLQRFNQEALSKKPQLRELAEACQKTLSHYRSENKYGNIKGQAVKPEELKKLKYKTNRPTKHDKSIYEFVLNSINKMTFCDARRTALKAGLLIAGSIGTYEMKCFTPTGRRLLLRGKSYGIGIGLNFSVTFPNTKFVDKTLNHVLPLYLHNENESLSRSHPAADINLGLGIVEEEDVFSETSIARGDLVSERYVKPSVGFGVMYEIVTNDFKKSFRSPLYARLATSMDLVRMAEGVVGKVESAQDSDHDSGKKQKQKRDSL